MEVSAITGGGRRAVTIGIAAFGILALIAAGANFYFRKAARVETFRLALEEAVTFQRRGDWRMAAEKFKQVLHLAPNDIATAEGKRLLAHSLLRSGVEEDRTLSLQLYKEVIADPATPVKWRALTLSDMAFAFDLTGDQALMDRAVFNEEPYAAYRRESRTGIYGALRKIYEQSDALHPTAFAKFEIAFKYAQALHRGMVEESLDAPKTARHIQEYVETASPLLPALPYETSVVAFMHLIEAFSLSVSESTLHNIEFSKIEAVYRQAISTARGAPPEDMQSKAVLFRIYPHYAGDLLARFGETRAADTRELLLAFLELRSIGLAEYARGVQGRPEDDPMRARFIEFARVSPEFRSFLVEEAGWRL